jgi:hypothetical protein
LNQQKENKDKRQQLASEEQLGCRRNLPTDLCFDCTTNERDLHVRLLGNVDFAGRFSSHPGRRPDLFPAVGAQLQEHWHAATHHLVQLVPKVWCSESRNAPRLDNRLGEIAKRPPVVLINRARVPYHFSALFWPLLKQTRKRNHLATSRRSATILGSSITRNGM